MQSFAESNLFSKTLRNRAKVLAASFDNVLRLLPLNNGNGEGGGEKGLICRVGQLAQDLNKNLQTSLRYANSQLHMTEMHLILGLQQSNQLHAKFDSKCREFFGEINSFDISNQPIQVNKVFVFYIS